MQNSIVMSGGLETYTFLRSVDDYYNMHATSVIDGNKDSFSMLFYTHIHHDCLQNYVLCTYIFMTTLVTNAIDRAYIIYFTCKCLLNKLPF